MRFADTLDKLPPYLFASIDEKKVKLIKEGKDVIDLGVGDPDMPTPDIIVNSMKKHLDNPAFYKYPSYEGDIKLREKISEFFKIRYGVKLDPDTEIIILIGSKEGIAHGFEAILNPGDKVVLPDPGYPVYYNQAILKRAKPVRIQLEEENGFIPDINKIPSDAKLICFNYPSNPTSAGVTESFYKDIAEFVEDKDMVIFNDAVYSEMYEKTPHPSMLQIGGLKEKVIEFHSFSKTYNMTGWRIGFAVGGKESIAALKKIKTNTDSGVFTAIQYAVMDGMEKHEEIRGKISSVYAKRRKIVSDALDRLNLEYHKSEYTFFVWVKVPFGNSVSFVEKLMEESYIITTPGAGFGKSADKYFRIALTVDESRIKEAMNRLEKVL